MASIIEIDQALGSANIESEGGANSRRYEVAADCDGEAKARMQ